MPLAVQRETCRAYELETLAVEPDAAQAMLKERLLEALEETVGEGEIVSTEFAVETADGMLTITLRRLNGGRDADHNPPGRVPGRDREIRARFHYKREPLNPSSAAERRIFCPIRAVCKAGNTYSIPPLFKLSTEPKSLDVSSCR